MKLNRLLSIEENSLFVYSKLKIFNARIKLNANSIKLSRKSYRH